MSASAISTGAESWAMIALVRALGDCSVAIWLFDGQTDNLGLMHVPRRSSRATCSRSPAAHRFG